MKRQHFLINLHCTLNTTMVRLMVLKEQIIPQWSSCLEKSFGWVTLMTAEHIDGNTPFPSSLQPRSAPTLFPEVFFHCCEMDHSTRHGFDSEWNEETQYREAGSHKPVTNCVREHWPFIPDHREQMGRSKMRGKSAVCPNKGKNSSRTDVQAAESWTLVALLKTAHNRDCFNKTLMTKTKEVSLQTPSRPGNQKGEGKAGFQWMKKAPRSSIPGLQRLTASAKLASTWVFIVFPNSYFHTEGKRNGYHSESFQKCQMLSREPELRR